MGYIYPMIDLLATGKRIKELRVERGISVRELQMFLGFEQPQAIYKWQRGECLPSFDNMYAIACYFNVKIDDILVGNRQEFFLPIRSEKVKIRVVRMNHPLLIFSYFLPMQSVHFLPNRINDIQEILFIFQRFF